VNSEYELRVAVAGFGTMGRKHTVNCTQIDGVKVAAVAVLDEAEGAVVSSETNLPFYIDAKKMLAEVPVDAIIIATPPGVRRDMVNTAIAAGTAVFIEKPIALDTDTAAGYRDAVKDSTIVNAVGFQLRYSPLAEEARRLISGRPVTHVRTMTTTSYYINMDVPLWFLQREHSGGPLLEQSIHMIDMARCLAGDITHVFARADRLTYPDVEHLDSEDTMVLAYRFAGGALGTHTDSCATTVFNWEIELFGPDWRLLLDFARKRLSGYINGDTIGKEFPDIDLHMLEMKAFLDAVRSKKTDVVRSDFADATKTLATVLTGDRSIKTGAWEPVSP